MEHLLVYFWNILSETFPGTFFGTFFGAMFETFVTIESLTNPLNLSPALSIGAEYPKQQTFASKVSPILAFW